MVGLKRVSQTLVHVANCNGCVYRSESYDRPALRVRKIAADLSGFGRLKVDVASSHKLICTPGN